MTGVTRDGQGNLINPATSRMFPLVSFHLGYMIQIDRAGLSIRWSFNNGVHGPGYSIYDHEFWFTAQHFLRWPRPCTAPYKTG